MPECLNMHLYSPTEIAHPEIRVRAQTGVHPSLTCMCYIFKHQSSLTHTASFPTSSGSPVQASAFLSKLSFRRSVDRNQEDLACHAACKGFAREAVHESSALLRLWGSRPDGQGGQRPLAAEAPSPFCPRMSLGFLG